MKLVIDIGNSKVKAGVFDKKQLIEIFIAPVIAIDFIKEINYKYKEIHSVILSTVKEVSDEVINYLKNNFHLIEFDSETKIPIKNYYKTPGTLGKDRLAGVIAANSIYPGENVLVIDAGTCVTFDLINSRGEYYGGSISPGLTMRFNALHTFTDKLPLIHLTNFNELTGTDTKESILAGVINGILAEAEGIIKKYSSVYCPLKIIICGGDAQFFAVRLNYSIFAVAELVLIGLNEILDYND